MPLALLLRLRRPSYESTLRQAMNEWQEGLLLRRRMIQIEPRGGPSPVQDVPAKSATDGILVNVGEAGLEGADGDASWSKSTHHGWVFGYGFEVVVSAPRRGLNWPVSGSLDSARVREAKTFPAKIPRLPPRTRYVLVDMGYDSNELGDAVEFSVQGKPTGRHLIGPQQMRHNCYGGRKRIWRETHQSRLRRARRVKRRQFSERRFGKALYKRRSKTVEPFFARFKELFDLKDHVRHTGLENNRTQILAVLVLYQILLVMNRIKGQNNAEVKWILDLL